MQVTKLKTNINDNTLSLLGAIEFYVTQGTTSGTAIINNAESNNGFSFKNYPVTWEIVSGSATFADGTKKLTQTEGASVTINNADGCKVRITSKYDLVSIQNSSASTVAILLDGTLANLTHCQELKILCFCPQTESVTTCLLDDVKGMKKLEKLYSTKKIGGNLNSLGYCPNLALLSITNATGVNGSLEDLCKTYVQNGRNSGTISVNGSKLQKVTFNSVALGTTAMVGDLTWAKSSNVVNVTYNGTTISVNL